MEALELELEAQRSCMWKQFQALTSEKVMKHVYPRTTPRDS